MWNLRMVNFDNFWGVSFVFKFHIFIVLNVLRTSTMWRIGTKFSQMWWIGTKSPHVWRIDTKSAHLWKIGIKSSHVKNWYQNSHVCRSVELVANPHTCEKLIPNITHMKNWYLIATAVSNKTVKNWNRMQNAADLGGGGYFINVRNTRMYAIWYLTSCVFFTKCEILIRNMWRIGTNFSRSVRNSYQFFTVWNLRSVKFAVQPSTRLQSQLAVKV